MATRVTGEAYLQVKAERAYWSKDVIGARIVKMTQNKPASVEQDCTVVKVRITVPVEAFEQVPVVDIELPAEALTQVTGEVVPA